jgi:4-amino-4-deoxy-L-arabinose transferase-like glycosyltransferase
MINNSKKTFILTAITLYLLAVVGVYLDSEKTNRWLYFGISSAATILIVLAPQNKRTLLKDIRSSIFHFLNDYSTIFIILFILITRFVLLNTYPFNSIGDELRDGGNLPIGIMNGQIDNIFGFGPYNGFGYLPSILLIPFQLLLPNSTLAFKIPAALVSSLDLILIFGVIKEILNKKAAIFTTLIMASLPLHLYYGRGEYLVMTSSLLSTLIFYLTYKLYKNFSEKRLVCLAAVLGLALGFQAALKIVILTSALFTAFLIIKRYFKQKSKLIHFSLSYICTLIISFGPIILFSNQETLFQANKVGLDSTSDLLNRYMTSLGVIGFNPTTSHFYLHAPILNTLYLFLFVLGVVLIINQTDKLLKNYFFAGILLIPFFNSTITNALNNDHRIIVILIYLAIGIGFGCNYIFKIIGKYPILNLPLYAALSFVVATNIYLFFANEYASYSMFLDTNQANYQNYLTTYMAKVVENEPLLKASPEICIYGNNFELDHKQRGHIKEYIRYLTNNKTLNFFEDPSLPERSIALSNNCNITSTISQAQVYTFCEQYNKFICPGDLLPIQIYVYRN